MSTVAWNDEVRQIEITSAPDYASTPIAQIDEIADWLRLDDATCQYPALRRLQAVAVGIIERITWRKLLPTGITLWLDWLPQTGPVSLTANLGNNEPYQTDGAIVLASGPVIDVTAIRYFDQDSNESTLDASSYRVDKKGAGWKARVYPADATTGSASWAGLLGTDLRASASVAIDYTAGYADAASVPPQLVHAIHMLVAHLYSSRGDCGDDAACAKACGAMGLIAPFRLTQS